MLLLLLCVLGEMVTIQFCEFNEQVYQCHWYLFSVEMQRIFGVFMSITQQTAVVRGFANALCTHEAFRKVTLLNFDIFKTNTFLDMNLLDKCFFFLYTTDHKRRLSIFHDASPHKWKSFCLKIIFEILPQIY